MTKIILRTLLTIDYSALHNEAKRLNKVLKQGDNNGITKVFFVEPDLTVAQKNVMQTLIDKIGTGSVT